MFFGSSSPSKPSPTDIDRELEAIRQKLNSLLFTSITTPEGFPTDYEDHARNVQTLYIQEAQRALRKLSNMSRLLGEATVENNLKVRSVLYNEFRGLGDAVKEDSGKREALYKANEKLGGRPYLE